MDRARKWVSATCLGTALLAGGVMATASPQAPTPAAPSYNTAEYTAFKAAEAEKDPQARIKLLDDLVAKNPAPTLVDLLPFVYRDYYLSYYASKDYPHSIDYVDRLLSLGDKPPGIDLGSKLEALIARGQGYFLGSGDKALQTPEQYTKARDASQTGLQTLAQWQKPTGMTDDAFAAVKKSSGILFNSVAGVAESGLKDYKAAADSYRAVLAIDPSDSLTHFRLGIADLQQTPPEAQDGYWELARSIALKNPSEAQVRSYLRNQLLHYQQPSCDKLVDDEMNEVITLAGSTSDRPTSLHIPSSDDLQKARDDTANFIPWLQEGGDHGKIMWLATCGLEYPDVVVRVMEIAPGDGDNVTLRVYRPLAADPDAATKEMEAAAAPNMEIHVVGQPDAKKLSKDDELRFTGKISGYQPSPSFLLTWDEAKINADDLKDLLTPAATPGAKKPARAPAAPKKSGA